MRIAILHTLYIDSVLTFVIRLEIRDLTIVRLSMIKELSLRVNCYFTREPRFERIPRNDFFFLPVFPLFSFFFIIISSFFERDDREYMVSICRLVDNYFDSVSVGSVVGQTVSGNVYEWSKQIDDHIILKGAILL